MPNKNIYYTEGFQEQVDALMKILCAQGVDLINPKQQIFSESKLFRYLVEEKLRTFGDEDLQTMRPRKATK